MKNKAFDCVAMKHAAAENIFEQLKTMTPAEQLAYWRQREPQILAKCKGTCQDAMMSKAA
jgi:hypothetical protein